MKAHNLHSYRNRTIIKNIYTCICKNQDKNLRHHNRKLKNQAYSLKIYKDLHCVFDFNDHIFEKYINLNNAAR